MSLEVVAESPLPVQSPPAKKSSNRYLAFLLSFRVMLAAGLSLISIVTITGRFNDPDLWYHLRLGQHIWSTASIPTMDTFSYSAYGHAWVAHEWLAQLSIYEAYRMGGYTGLMLWLALFSSLIPVLVYALCYLRCRNPLAAFLGGVSAWFFATVGLAVRPQMIGYTLLAIELLLLELASRDRRWLWALPPLFGIWVNCHGSFLFGIGVLFLYFVTCLPIGGWGLVARETCAGWKMPAFILALSVVALRANPVGFRLLVYPLDVAFHQSTSLNNIEEWLPPNLLEGRGLGMLVAAASVLLIPLLSRRELQLRELLWSAMAFGLALQHVRMLFVFGIVISPVLCRLTAPLLGRSEEKRHPFANGLLLAAMLATAAFAFPDVHALERQVRQRSPAGAIEFLRRAGLHGPIVNDYQFGGYLMWAMPEEKVFVDARGDVFDWTGVLAEYGRWVTNVEDANLLLNKYQAELCLLSKNAPVLAQLSRLPNWKRVYVDEVAIVYSRQGALQ